MPTRRFSWPGPRLSLLSLAGFGLAGSAFAMLATVQPVYRTLGAPQAEADMPPAADVASLRADNETLRARLDEHVPGEAYIVVDRTNNRLFLRQGDELLLDAVASTGSGKTLRDDARDRQWTFDTPRGEFRVLEERRNPVWIRPDWAFIEEGKPIPRTTAERAEKGSLGEFGLYFGDGFIIHGTLYERLLGRSVSHGCVRLGRDDLRQLVAATGVGTRIFIY